MFALCLLNLLLFPIIQYKSYSINNANELFEISFEELMLTNVQTGTLLSMSNLLKPAMVTTITSNDLRTNASVNLKLLDNVLISLFVMNFTNLNNNYRYKYEAGDKASNYFFRMNVLEEPFTYGLTVSYDF